MKSIKYVSPHGEAEPLHLGGVDIKPGEAFTVSDDLAKEYFESPRFVDAVTGKNPNFTCIKCGEPALMDGIFDPILARTAMSPIRSLIQPDGRRVCAQCVGSVAQTVVPDSIVQIGHDVYRNIDEDEEVHDIDDD